MCSIIMRFDLLLSTPGRPGNTELMLSSQSIVVIQHAAHSQDLVPRQPQDNYSNGQGDEISLDWPPSKND